MNKRILIVDDDKFTLFMTKACIGACNSEYEVVTASSGAECIDIVKKDQSFDLLIVDFQMPVMDGVDTLCELRKLENGDSLNVVIYTSDSEELINKRLENVGIKSNGFLKKPCDVGSLKDFLKSCF